ncbi:PRC-barrel domain-containing protein [Sulfitobacter sp. HNIBRBA3233]|uniref:PRC-barrel domain-containing protein n=1 Tax=Sulfitobacter marinivivus TaxID=3158558 RepID=UPI0032DF7969
MTRKMMTTAAAILATTAGMAFAESHSSGGMMDTSNLIAAGQIEDGAIYRMDTTVEGTTWTDDATYTTVDTNWVKVGDISDVLLNRDGQMVGVLAEIGGFLDIGDRDVILSMETVKFVGGGEDRQFNYVTNLTEEELEALPEVDEGIFDD